MTRLAILVFHTLLKLYPRHFRAEFEAEMQTVFQQKVQERAATGWWPQLVVLLQELRDWPANCLQAHWQGWQNMNLPVRRIFKWLALLLVLAGVGWLSTLIWLIGMAEAPKTRAIALADLDGDGDLDAFLNNRGHEAPAPAAVLLNEGNGRFQELPQNLSWAPSEDLLLYDVEGDGDIDALQSNWDSRAKGEYNSLFWLNDGTGQFLRSGHLSLGQTDDKFIGDSSRHFAVGDLNGDGLPDLFSVGCCGGAHQIEPPGKEMVITVPNRRVWLGQADRLPQDSGQALGGAGAEAVALGDLDGDGDLDAFVASNSTFSGNGPSEPAGNEVWLNDGTAVFHSRGQTLGELRSFAVALGDVDGDGDLDAAVGNIGPDEIWLNDGTGQFSDSGQRFRDRWTDSIFLADLDADGDLDLITDQDGRRDFPIFPLRRVGFVWLNEGNGRFSQNAQQITYPTDGKITIGDVNNDSAPDIVIGLVDKATIYLNDGEGHFTSRTVWSQAMLRLLGAFMLIVTFVLWRRHRRQAPPKPAS